MYSCASNATPILVVFMMVLTMISPCVEADSNHIRDRRVIPHIQNCDPNISDNTNPKKCLKGDWIDSSIADCKMKQLLTQCRPQFSRNNVWVVEQPQQLYGCQATANKPINCAEFVDSRCVCSSNPKDYFNHCKCQYWPSETNVNTRGSVCYGYQQGDEQWACCYNIQNTDCYTQTWQISSQSQDLCRRTDQGITASYIFNCGDCGCLQGCKSACETAIRSRFGTASPNRCGAWLNCFRGCCVKAFTGQNIPRSQRSIKKRQPVPMEFCGDGLCQRSSESPSNCPEDCCHVFFPSSCPQPSSDTCADSCCQTSSCCQPSKSGTSPAVHNTYTPGILLLALCAPLFM